jgi:pSer/pThr/pTyr-binding forkhead associated (FHA) protein
VGRAEENDVVIDSPLVSRRHARIVLADGAYLIEDLESRNGTLVNGQEVARRQLAHDDAITLGDSTLVFLLDVAASDGARPAEPALAMAGDGAPA